MLWLHACFYCFDMLVFAAAVDAMPIRYALPLRHACRHVTPAMPRRHARHDAATPYALIR